MTELIKCYGEYWNPDIVEWGKKGAGNSGKLIGKIKPNNRHIDFWDARGVYVLHENFKVVYVGKAFKTQIGKRLRDHLSDRLAGRWDMFSWYSTSAVRQTRKDVSKPGQRQIRPVTIIDTMEALAILIADPALNRKRETLPNAFEAEQVSSPNPYTIRHYLHEILDKMKKIDSQG